MQSSLVLTLGLPLALVVIMLGVGLSLSADDFRAVILKPKPLIIGLACQMAIMPAVCFALVSLSTLPPVIAVGMMLLAASPTGPSAALFTHLSRGDVALAITITAITSVLAIVTLPIVAKISLLALLGQQETVSIAFGKILQTFGLAIVPVVLGMAIKSRAPIIASRLDRPVKTLASVFLALVVAVAFVMQWDLVATWAPTIGATALACNLAGLALGLIVPLLLGVPRRQAVALSMCVGIHNAGLIITMALSAVMLDDPEMAIAPAIYGLLAYFTAAAAVWVFARTIPISSEPAKPL